MRTLVGSDDSRTIQTPIGDVVEVALADALSRAAAAGEWQVVAALAAELSVRRTAREAGSKGADVVDLATHRRGR